MTKIAKHHYAVECHGDYFYMEHKTIEYCVAALKVYSAILDDGKTHFTYDEGKSLAGIYWMNIVKEMVESKVGYSDYGEFNATITSQLLPLRGSVNDLLKKLQEDAEDRELSNKEKRENIKYGRKGYRLSIVAIIISLVTLLFEFYKYLTV